MDSKSVDDHLQELLTLHGQIFRLLREMKRLPVEARQATNRPFARQYNRLRERAVILAGDLNVADLAPQKAWYVPKVAVIGVLLGGFGVALGAYVEFYGLWFGAYLSEWVARLGVLLFFWILAVAPAVLVVWVVRRRQTVLAATAQEVYERAILLLAYVRENVRDADPASEMGLPIILDVGDPPGEAPSSAMKQTHPGANAAAELTALGTGRFPRLTEAQRRHLRSQKWEQQTHYDQLTARIEAVTGDLGRETDSERELVLRDRRQKLVDEREQVQTLLGTIERALSDDQASASHSDDRG